MENFESVDVAHQTIEAYNPEWKERFENEKEKLEPIFGDQLVSIEHIGSTAIEGMSGKPIVDIAVLIKHHERAEDFIAALENAGYGFDKEVHNSQQSHERHFFRKGNPSEYHLSIAYADKARFLERQLMFRDYLREHPKDVEKYNNLKKDLIAQDPTGKDTYIGNKTEFVNDILDKAGFE